MPYNIDRRDQVWKEIEKTFPAEANNSEGCILFDFSIYASVPQDNLILDFDLIREDKMTEFSDGYAGRYDECYSFKHDSVKDFRYHNKNLVTLSRGRGKDTCIAGYPIFGSIIELNNYKGLAVYVGRLSGTGYNHIIPVLIPIEINLTEETPVSCLKMRVSGVPELGKDISLYLESTGTKRTLTYLYGENRFTWGLKDIIPLTVTDNTDISLLFRQTVMLQSSEKDSIY